MCIYIHICAYYILIHMHVCICIYKSLWSLCRSLFLVRWSYACAYASHTHTHTQTHRIFNWQTPTVCVCVRCVCVRCACVRVERVVLRECEWASERVTECVFVMLCFFVCLQGSTVMLCLFFCNAVFFFLCVCREAHRMGQMASWTATFCFCLNIPWSPRFKKLKKKLKKKSKPKRQRVSGQARSGCFNSQPYTLTLNPKPQNPKP